MPSPQRKGLAQAAGPSEGGHLALPGVPQGAPFSWLCGTCCIDKALARQRALRRVGGRDALPLRKCRPSIAAMCGGGGEWAVLVARAGGYVEEGCGFLDF